MKRALLLSCLLLPGCATLHHAAAPKPASADAGLTTLAQSDLYLGVVEGLIRQQRYQAAIAFLAKYQQTATPTPRFRLLAGDALAGAGRNAEAIASYRAALQSDRAAPAYNGIGRAQSAQGHWGEAAENFRHAALLDPANANYLNNLGYALLKQNVTGAQASPALDALSRAHELAPDETRITDNLALATARAGSTAQLHTLLDTIPDSGRRRLVADLAATWSPAQGGDTVKGAQP